MKNFENRLKFLEIKLIPQLPVRSIVITTTGSIEYFINGELFVKPIELNENDFFNSSKKRN